MPEWSTETDVLVAGSGAGGATGAYTAAREGLDVVLVEATDRFGGTTAYSGGGMWFPGNSVLRRAGTDDTVDDALEYYTAVVGDRTPRALQETYVRGGAPLIEYLEADELLKFQLLPWPDYFGKAPKARGDGMRHIAAKAFKVAAAPDLRGLIRGPVDSDRLGTPQPEDYFVGGRALIARLLTATERYPRSSRWLNTSLAELVVEDGAVVAPSWSRLASTSRSAPGGEFCWRPEVLRTTRRCAKGTGCLGWLATRWAPAATSGGPTWLESPSAPTPT
jgi:3-oxosteroid 1-dehydrogenase